MAYLDDAVKDGGLDLLNTSITTLHITSAEATTRANAISLSLGNSAVSIPVPEDDTTVGRKVAVPEITAGSVTATGAAVAWAIIDNGSLLLAAGTLNGGGQTVTDLNSFTLATFDISIIDAVAG